MVSRTLVASVVLIGALVPGSFAMKGDRSAHQQSAIVQFERPTWVAGEMLIGTYMIVHDEDKMERGEPCTTFYRLRAEGQDEAVSFRCIPRARRVAPSLTITVNSVGGGIDTFDTLTEYQFAGDAEGHGVPIGVSAERSRSNPVGCGDFFPPS